MEATCIWKTCNLFSNWSQLLSSVGLCLVCGVQWLCFPPSISVWWKLIQVSDVLQRWEFTPLLLFPCRPLWHALCQSLADVVCRWQLGLHSLACSTPWLLSRSCLKQRWAVGKSCWLAEGKSLEFACYSAVLSGKRWTLLDDRVSFLNVSVMIMTLSVALMNSSFCPVWGCLRLPWCGKWSQ